MGNAAKASVNNFEWIEDISQFNEVFMKNYNVESDKGYFLEVDIQYTKKLHELHSDLPSLTQRMEIKSRKSCS